MSQNYYFKKVLIYSSTVLFLFFQGFLLSYSQEGKILLYEDFEGVESFGPPPDGWLVIDADGDDSTFVGIDSNFSIWLTPLSGEKAICSFSSCYYMALSPDNYLITPDISGATNLTYYYAVNASYPDDHYGVMVSTTGTDIEDFTMIFEETPTITKSIKGNISDNKQDKLSNAQSQWIERNLDLPQGTKYIAFRHYDSYDNNYILFENITISDGEQNFDPVTDLTADINGNNVTLSWEAPVVFDKNKEFEMSLDYVTTDNELLKRGEAVIIMEAHDVWEDGVTGYQFLLDADHDQYGQTIPEAGAFTSDCNIPDDLYDVFEYKIPANADPSCESTNVIIDGIDSVIIPGGIYDYCIVSPNAGIKIYIVGPKLDPTRADDFIFESGKRYHYLIKPIATGGDGAELTVTGEGLETMSYNVYRDDIIIASEITENHYTDENVDPGNYNYCVEVKYSNGLSPQECLNVDILGISDQNYIVISPNPAKDIVYINGVDIEKVNVYNFSGQLIGVYDNSKIDVSAYLSGVYIFNVITKQGSIINTKIIVY